MLDFADMFSLLGTCTLLYAQANFKHSFECPAIECPGVDLVYKITYLHSIVLRHEGTCKGMTRKASFAIVARIRVATSSIYILLALPSLFE